MKKLILLSLGFVFNVQAQVMTMPYVNNFGYNAQVQIHNQNDYTIICSGTIHMQLSSGTSESQYFSEFIFAKNFVYRSIYPMRRNDRINFVNHSIFCRPS